MSGALPVHVTLRAFFGAAYTGLPFSTSTGSTVLLTIEARNTVTGALVDVTGLRVRQDRPDGANITLDEGEVASVSTGRYGAEVFIGPSGDWTFNIECEEPRPAETKAWLRASGPPAAENAVGTGGALLAAPGNRPLEMTLFKDVPVAAPFTGGEGLLIAQDDDDGVTQPRFATLGLIRQDALATVAPAVEQVTTAAATVATQAGQVADGLAALPGTIAGELADQVPPAVAAEATAQVSAKVDPKVTQAQAAQTGAQAAQVAAELARDLSAAGANLYASTTAGLAAVAEGATFNVAGAGDTYAITYRKTGGAAVEVARTPSKAAVDAIPAKTRGTAGTLVRGLADLMTGVDKLGRVWMQAGLRHLRVAGLSVDRPTNGPWTLSGPRGPEMVVPLSGVGPTDFPNGPIKNKPTVAPFQTGDFFAVRDKIGRLFRVRIHPALGVLHIAGTDPTAGVSGDFTAAEFATLSGEAADYSDGVVRRVTSLKQPTEGLVLWISFGQSLSVGAAGVPTITRAALSTENLMMGLSVHGERESYGGWAPIGGPTLNPLVAASPNASPSTGVETPEEEAARGPSDAKRGETYLTAFAHQFRTAWLRSRGKLSDPNNRFVFAACGVGGVTLAQLMPGAPGNYFQRFRDVVTLAKAQADALGVSFSVGGILFDQGQSDQGVTSYGDYLGNLTTLFDGMRSYVAGVTGQTGILPIYLIQSGSANDGTVDAGELQIARAQLDAARTTPGVYVVSGNQAVPDRGVHITANGYRWIGCQAAKVAERTIINGEGWEDTRAIRWVVRGTTLVGLFHAPVAPLRFVPAYIGRGVAPAYMAVNRGVYLTDSLGAVPITAVRVQSDRLIVATLGRTVSGTAKAWLGSKDGANAAICVADSDMTRLALPYDYTAGSGQSTDENIPALVGLAYPAANIALADCQAVTPA
jgi:hypothetical protein